EQPLRVASPPGDIDAAQHVGPIEGPPSLREPGDVRRPPAPARRRGRVEADLVDHGVCAIHVRTELPSAPQGVDDEPPAAPGEDELTEVDVPVALPRPADGVACSNALAGLDERFDVAVTEMPDAGEPTHAA